MLEVTSLELTPRKDPIFIIGSEVSENRSVVSKSLQSHGLQPARVLCPWYSPGKNTRVCFHFLLQGIFLTQDLNPCPLHWQVDSLPQSHLGSPFLMVE